MKTLVMFIILLIISVPLCFAEQVQIPETFKAEGGPVVTSYFYTGNNLVATKDSNGIKYYSSDRLGSNRLITDSSANQIGETKTLPFGEEIINDNKFSFTGKELDSELYYFGARYYDFDTGRFTSVDPVAENHDYNYVNNNPEKFVDALGNDPARPGGVYAHEMVPVTLTAEQLVPTHRLNQDVLDAKLISIAWGLDTPPWAMPIYDSNNVFTGKYQVMQGHHRIAANLVTSGEASVYVPKPVDNAAEIYSKIYGRALSESEVTELLIMETQGVGLPRTPDAPNTFVEALNPANMDDGPGGIFPWTFDFSTGKWVKKIASILGSEALGVAGDAYSAMEGYSNPSKIDAELQENAKKIQKLGPILGPIYGYTKNFMNWFAYSAARISPNNGPRV